MKHLTILLLTLLCLSGLAATAQSTAPVGLSFDDAPYIHRAGSESPIHFKLRVTNNTAGPYKTTVHLSPSSAFRLLMNMKERSIPVEFTAGGETKVLSLNLALEGGIGQRDVYLSAVADGQAGAAIARVRVFDLNIPENLRVGVIEDNDNTTTRTLARLGIPYEALGEGKIAVEKLKAFQTILIDGAAYNSHKDLAQNNAAMLGYVKQGGTVIIMGHAAVWKSCYAPHPFAAAHKDLAKNALIKILAPEHALFKSPNAIDEWDWAEWVHNEGIDLPTEWDKKYTPLVDCGGPGAVLMCEHGKGAYVYTSLSWRDQLNAPHPGALRLFVNLLAVGKPAKK
jgi:hypothetical protein